MKYCCFVIFTSIFTLSSESFIRRIRAEATGDEYDERLALQMSLFAAASYSNNDQDRINCINYGSVHEDWQLLQAVGGESLLCGFVIAESRAEDRVVVAFRGSENYDNLYNQIKSSFFSIPVLFNDTLSDWSRVVSHYAKAANNVWPMIKTQLETLYPRLTNRKKLVFTGHSKGGAVAVLAATRAAAEGVWPRHLIQLYTFGQPCVGNIHFVLLHQKLIPESFRVVHGKDLVPRGFHCGRVTADVLGDAVFELENTTNNGSNRDITEHLPPMGFAAFQEIVRRNFRRRKSHLKTKINEMVWDTLVGAKYGDGEQFYYFMQGTEVWYPDREPPREEELANESRSPMPSTSRIAALGEAQSNTTGNETDRPTPFYLTALHKYSKYAHDHQFYFGIHLSIFGRAGCEWERYQLDLSGSGYGNSQKEKKSGHSPEKSPTKDDGEEKPSSGKLQRSLFSFGRKKSGNPTVEEEPLTKEEESEAEEKASPKAII